MSAQNDIIDALTRSLIDEGRLIEAGWQALRALALPVDAPQVQVVEMRLAYFAGAQHLFASIMGSLDAGSEPTDDDLRRMANIGEELHAFYEEMMRAFS